MARFGANLEGAGGRGGGGRGFQDCLHLSNASSGAYPQVRKSTNARCHC